MYWETIWDLEPKCVLCREVYYTVFLSQSWEGPLSEVPCTVVLKLIVNRYSI